LKVKVRYLAFFRDLTKCSEEVFEIPESEAKVADILTTVSEKYPRMKDYVNSGEFVVLLNNKSAGLGDTVVEGDEVILMPPISGGSHYAFVDSVDPVVLLEAMLKALDDSAGAVAVFIGRVKGSIDGKKVSELYYETFEPMSTSALAKIGEEESLNHGLLYATIYHKKGSAKPGEPVLFIGVASESRENALSALGAILERVKHEAYVWKLEKREDGEFWILGDRKRVPRG